MAFRVCIFCFRDRPLTREHLISKPIATALKLDRSAIIGEFDNPPEGPDVLGIRFVELGDMKVRVACRECNNGWMAALETAAAKVFLVWLKRGRLRIGEYETIGRWLATRLIIWTARDGGGRNLAEALDVGGAAIPHFDRAKRLGAGARDALEGLAIGAARANGGATYGFGNASTEPNCPSSPATTRHPPATTLASSAR